MNLNQETDIFSEQNDFQFLNNQSKGKRKSIVYYNVFLMAIFLVSLIWMFYLGWSQYGITNLILRFIFLFGFGVLFSKFINLNKIGWYGLMLIDCSSLILFVAILISFIKENGFSDPSNIVTVFIYILILFWSVNVIRNFFNQNIRTLFKI